MLHHVASSCFCEMRFHLFSMVFHFSIVSFQFFSYVFTAFPWFSMLLLFFNCNVFYSIDFQLSSFVLGRRSRMFSETGNNGDQRYAGRFVNVCMAQL